MPMLLNTLRALLLALSVLTGASVALELFHLPETVSLYQESVRTEAVETGVALLPGSDALAWFALTANHILGLAVALLAAALVLASARKAALLLLAMVLLGLFASPLDSLTSLGLDLGAWEGEPRTMNILGMGSLAYFLAHFPRALSLADLAAAAKATLGRRLIRMRSALAFRSGAFLLHPWRPWILSGVILVLTLWAQVQDSLLEFLVFWGYLAWTAATGIHLLKVQVTTGEEEARKAALSLFAALNMLAWTILLLLFAALPAAVWVGVRWGLSISVPIDILLALGLLASLLLLSYATFVKGAADPRLVIRRTAVFGLMGLLSVFVLGGAEAVGSNLLVQTLSLPDQASGWIAGGALAVAFGPARTLSRRWVDRLYLSRLPVDFLVSGPKTKAAVLFVDLAGYTRISAEDPDRALHALTVLHRSGYTAVGQSRGRVVKTIGDAIMAAFPDSVSAGRAMLDLGPRFEQAVTLLDLGELYLSAGIDEGEVAEGPDGDLFGQVVNLAARLQGAAEAGQILVSQKVAEALGGQEGFAVEAAGVREFKNVPEPTQVFLLRNEKGMVATGHAPPH